MKRSLLWMAGLALLIFPIVAAAGETTVKVSHTKLKPPKIIIDVGDKVTFLNRVTMPGGHTIVADDGSFTGTPLPKPGDSWSHTFDKAGTYSYHIKEHPSVKATITVKLKKKSSGYSY